LEQVGFIGCGSWGGALGKILSEKDIPVIMWHRNPQIVKKLDESRIHYLIPELVFNKKVKFTNDFALTIQSSSVIVIALPSQTIRSIIEENISTFNKNKIIVNVSKGIEIDTLMTVSDLLNNILGIDYDNIVALSGPSHAEEVIRKHPTTLVAASKNVNTGIKIQNLFATDYLRTYLSDDVKGVEIGGALKNVIAIAAGICDGIGYGDNSKAALMTRGMAEITNLGNAMGGKEETFRGLSGFGDLIVTCLSKHSRNRNLGEAIGEGKLLNQILNEMDMIAEGVNTAKSVHQLSEKYNIEMPIHDAIYNVLFSGKNPGNSVKELMNRKLSLENK